MPTPHWNIFEWDDAEKKNGNVQHLRDHGIEPHEAEECFFHKFLFSRDYRRFDDVYLLEGRTDGGRRLNLCFRIKVTTWCECLPAGSWNQRKSDEKAFC